MCVRARVHVRARACVCVSLCVSVSVSVFASVCVLASVRHCLCLTHKPHTRAHTRARARTHTHTHTHRERERERPYFRDQAASIRQCILKLVDEDHLLLGGALLKPQPDRVGELRVYLVERRRVQLRAGHTDRMKVTDQVRLSPLPSAVCAEPVSVGQMALPVQFEGPPPLAVVFAARPRTPARHAQSEGEGERGREGERERERPNLCAAERCLAT